MIRLAFRNLFQNKIRLVISVGGVALALLLILSLDAIFRGVEQRVTAYIDHSGADIWVSQEVSSTCIWRLRLFQIRWPAKSGP